MTDVPNELSERMKKLDAFLRTNLEVARDSMKRYADKHRAESERYKPGDRVLLSLENIKSIRPKTKWSDKRTGPYKIIKEAHPNSDSYVLDLPSSWSVYPVFHTSLLTPYHANTIDGRAQPPSPAVIIDGDEEYEIECIVNVRRYYNKLQYLVKWVGYPIDERNDWYDEDGLVHAQALLKEFKSSHNLPPAKRRRKK